MHWPQVRAMAIVVPCLRQRQSVDCDCLPRGSVGAPSCDWEQQLSSRDTGQLTWPLPGVYSGLHLKNTPNIYIFVYLRTNYKLLSLG